MRVICTGVHACIISVDYKRFIDLKKKTVFTHILISPGEAYSLMLSSTFLYCMKLVLEEVSNLSSVQLKYIL